MRRFRLDSRATRGRFDPTAGLTGFGRDGRNSFRGSTTLYSKGRRIGRRIGHQPRHHHARRNEDAALTRREGFEPTPHPPPPNDDATVFAPRLAPLSRPSLPAHPAAPLYHRCSTSRDPARVRGDDGMIHRRRLGHPDRVHRRARRHGRDSASAGARLCSRRSWTTSSKSSARHRREPRRRRRRGGGRRGLRRGEARRGARNCAPRASRATFARRQAAVRSAARSPARVAVAVAVARVELERAPLGRGAGADDEEEAEAEGRLQ